MKYLLFLFILASPFAFSASFDCQRAENRIEKIICDRPDISLLDDALAEALFDAKDKLKNPDKLRASQLAWLKVRNNCESETCVLTEYEKRLVIVSTWSEDGESKLTFQVCKNSTTQLEIIECIKKGIYDPCNEGGGMHSGQMAACGWGHLEIAEERLKRVTSRIKNRISKYSKSKEQIEAFEKSELNWLLHRNTYCEFTNIFAVEGGAATLAVAFCKRRLTEGHVKELESILPEISSVIGYVLSSEKKKSP